VHGFTRIWLRPTSLSLVLCAVSFGSFLRAQTAVPVIPNAPSATRIIPPELSGRQRWHKYVRDTYASAPIYLASFGSALGLQTTNTPTAWGRSASGYFKRAGTEYASFAIQNSVYQGGSALLHNQVQYVPCQCPGFWHRSGYALQMTALTYHNGHKVIDVPQFAGAYAGGMIPILWYPRGYSPLGEGAVNGTVQLGLMAGVDEIREFAPEVKRFLHKLKP
jgi:hypothetical protein